MAFNPELEALYRDDRAVRLANLHGLDWWWNQTPAFRRAYARARYEADHAVTVPCSLGCCELYIFNGREIGSIGPAGCPHAEYSRKLTTAYRRRVLARRRRKRS
jgi:hypothetical protein